MPNICWNELTITGPKEDLDRFQTAARGTVGNEPLAFSLRSLYPIPAPLDTGQPIAVTDTGENWYSWCVRHWGTKWDVLEGSTCRREGVETLGFTFETAWDPPLQAFTEAIAPAFPRLAFTLHFEDPNIDRAGECEWKEGRLVRQEACGLSDRWEQAGEEDSL